MNKKSIILVVLVVILVAAAGIGYWLKLGVKTPKKDTTNDLIIKDNRLSEAQLTQIKSDFETQKGSIAKDQNDFNAWISMGLLKKSVNDFEGARDAWIKAGEIRPTNSLSFANLGDLYSNFLNQPQEAEKVLLIAQKNDPSWAQVYTTLADLYRFKLSNKQVEAESILLEGLKNTNNDSSIVAYLAGFYKDTKNYSKALIYFKQMLINRPNDQTIKDEIASLEKKI